MNILEAENIDLLGKLIEFDKERKRVMDLPEFSDRMLDIGVGLEVEDL
jgi:hypothetical protein